MKGDEAYNFPGKRSSMHHNPCEQWGLFLKISIIWQDAKFCVNLIGPKGVHIFGQIFCGGVV